MIKNYIFDFDGTLADTGTGIIKTMQESFRLHGLTVPSDDEVKSVIGLPLAGSVKALGISERNSIDEICATYRRLFPDVAVESISIFPEVKETLAKLKSHHCTVSIATSRSEESLRMIMKRHGIDDIFDRIVSASDNLPAKPLPDMVLTILRDLDIEDSETMVIGDTTFDIEMGNAVHCWTVAVTYGNHSREKLLTANPNFLIANMGELLSLSC